MGETVEHCGRHFGVAEDLRPIAKARFVVMSKDVFS